MVVWEGGPIERRVEPETGKGTRGLRGKRVRARLLPFCQEHELSLIGLFCRKARGNDQASDRGLVGECAGGRGLANM